ncbi:MAG: hypothetical protein ACI9YP_000708 [Colwellia sp.]|jgi:hypothetical protein
MKFFLKPKIYFICSVLAMLVYFYIRGAINNISERMPYELVVPGMGAMLYLYLYLIENRSDKGEKIVGFVGLYSFGFLFISLAVYELFNL